MDVVGKVLKGDQQVDMVGLSMHAPGAYAEQLLVNESLMMPVPNRLSPDIAALTEPMAVGWHAVRRGEVGKRDSAIVIGCSRSCARSQMRCSTQMYQRSRAAKSGS